MNHSRDCLRNDAGSVITPKRLARTICRVYKRLLVSVGLSFLVASKASSLIVLIMMRCANCGVFAAIPSGSDFTETSHLPNA